MYLRQPGFTYSAGSPFTKHHERIQKFRETCNLKHLYRDELHKACFAHDAAYSDSKYLAKRTISDKILNDKTCKIDRNPKYNGYQRTLESMVCKYFDKKTGSGASVNEELSKELHKPVSKKFKRKKVYARFEDNVRVADLAKWDYFFSE